MPEIIIKLGVDICKKITVHEQEARRINKRLLEKDEYIYINEPSEDITIIRRENIIAILLNKEEAKKVI